MKKKCKKIISSILVFAMMISTALPVAAKESIGNGVILSTDNVVVTEGTATTITASLGEGFDASRLTCIVADPNVVTVTPAGSVANVASFQVSYVGDGSTVIAVTHLDNPAVIAYATVTSSKLVMEIPSKLGTNKKNYCELVDYEFVPYDFKYADFNDYKSTLNIRYKLASYEDRDFTKWGCYGYFYDAEGNVLSKVHLYCSSMAVGRTYHSEFNVPVNAVKFSIEGFNSNK